MEEKQHLKENIYLDCSAECLFFMIQVNNLNSNSINYSLCMKLYL